VASKNNQNKTSAQQRARLQAYEAKQQLVGNKAARRKRDNRTAVIAAVLAVVIALGAQLSYAGFGPDASNPTATPTASVNAVPDKALAENRQWTGSMVINKKPLTITLDGVKAPQAVANFISLANKGFFKDTTCHRLVTAGISVLQCGDPKGDGTGGPGYSWGPIENPPVGNNYLTGDIAMARQSDNASSMGSQFFIVYADSNIPADSVGGYTVFGHVTAGGSAVFNPILAAGVEGKDAKGKPLTDGKPALTTTIGAITLK